jgi:hypothetical protein
MSYYCKVCGKIRAYCRCRLQGDEVLTAVPSGVVFPIGERRAATLRPSEIGPADLDNAFRAIDGKDTRPRGAVFAWGEVTYAAKPLMPLGMAEMANGFRMAGGNPPRPKGAVYTWAEESC